MRAIAVGAGLVSVFACVLAVGPGLAETIHGVDVGDTVLLADRTQTSGCTLGDNPDRRRSVVLAWGSRTRVTESR
jgi:hypothetical protein